MYAIQLTLRYSIDKSPVYDFEQALRMSALLYQLLSRRCPRYRILSSDRMGLKAKLVQSRLGRALQQTSAEIQGRQEQKVQMPDADRMNVSFIGQSAIMTKGRKALSKGRILDDLTIGNAFVPNGLC